MIDVHADFETRCDVDLKKRGQGPYFESPHWKALLLSYAIGDGPTQCWDYTQPLPDDLRAALEAGARIHAHNAAFERQCFEQQHKRLGWPLPRAYVCTAVTAAAMSLPRSLENMGAALALNVRKDKEGARLIAKFCKPRKPTKKEQMALFVLHNPGESLEETAKTANALGTLLPHQVINGLYWNEPEDHPEEFARFRSYCIQDTDVERAGERRLIPLSAYEQRVYELDQKINARGVRIDVRSARAAVRLAERVKDKLDAAICLQTGGYVTACTQASRLTTWAQNAGVDLQSAGRNDVAEALADKGIPESVRSALETRQEAAKSSVLKIKSMLARVNADGRLYNAYMMNGAGTGRWTSTGVNIANLPRPRKVFEDAHLSTSTLFEALRSGDPDWLDFLYGDELGRPLYLIADSIRGLIWAAAGHDLIQADYSSIEGCVIAWSSGEEWKVQALHQIFADPSIPDLYRQTAAKIMNTTTDVITKKHPYRQSVGKVPELALGFGGGVAAFDSMSAIYGVQLDPLYGPVWETADEDRRDKAVWRYENCLRLKKEKTDVLSRNAWVACEIIKAGWRESNAAITAGWHLREDAVRDAIRDPGKVTTALKFSYLVRHGFLWTCLPSGRCLAYGAPRLTPQVKTKILLDDGGWSEPEPADRDLAEKMELAGKAQIVGDTRPRISGMSVDSKTKRWRRTHLYGGKLAENDTQATARDILVNGMFNVEAAGYPIVAHVYDEAIAEIPRGFGSVSEYESLLCKKPEWAAGLPLAANGWRGKRYRKD